jgi:hypothetical protein
MSGAVGETRSPRPEVPGRHRSAICRSVRVAALAALGPGATALLGLGLVACEAPGEGAPPAMRAEFGILYGGQVQQRDEIPFELDTARQRQGFRLTQSPPATRALEVHWELGKPGKGRRQTDSRGRKARPRQVQLGRAHFRPGEALFEQVLPFFPDDPLGLWNIRVLVDNRVVIDRPFVVFDPVERTRRREAAEQSDAGW